MKKMNKVDIAYDIADILEPFKEKEYFDECGNGDYIYSMVTILKPSGATAEKIVYAKDLIELGFETRPRLDMGMGR